LNPLKMSLQIAIDKAEVKKAERLQRKLDFVLSDQMPMGGMSGIPIEVHLALGYDLEVRDIMVTRLISMLESIFEDMPVENVLIEHFKGALKEAVVAMGENPYLKIHADSMKEMEALITTKCPEWDK
jgi:hypothetical protein